MKKSELKSIIKECIKEVIFEDGVLSGIITEVASGLTASTALIQESRPASAPPRNPALLNTQPARDKVLDAIGKNGYEDVRKKFSNPALFEGTSPIPPSGEKSGPLSGVAPGDAGIDISKIPGMGNWGIVAQAIK
jgi:hypothetical protein